MMWHPVYYVQNAHCTVGGIWSYKKIIWCPSYTIALLHKYIYNIIYGNGITIVIICRRLLFLSVNYIIKL